MPTETTVSKTKQGELAKAVNKVENAFLDFAGLYVALTDIYEHTTGTCECGKVMSQKEFNNKITKLLSSARKEARDKALTEAIEAVGEDGDRWDVDMSINPLDKPMTENEIGFANGYDNAKGEIRQRLKKLKEKK